MPDETEVNALLRKARQGAGSGISLGDCIQLKQDLDPAVTFPIYCNQLIHRAKTSGVLARRASKVARAWDMADGHGKTKLSSTETPGAMDNVANPATAESASDIFLHHQSKAGRDKIHRLNVRTASKGGVPRVPFGQWTASQENQKAVVIETKKELVRRKSRREEMKAKTATATAAPVA